MTFFINRTTICTIIFITNFFTIPTVVFSSITSKKTYNFNESSGLTIKTAIHVNAPRTTEKRYCISVSVFITKINFFDSTSPDIKKL